MNTSLGPRRIATLAYVADGQAPLYRTIMRLFMESKDRFVFRLRLLEVIDGVRRSGVDEIPDAQIDTALARLCEWGNLRQSRAVIDRAYKGSETVPLSFELTEQGEAAEKALPGLDAASFSPGLHSELQRIGLSDIQRCLQELERLLQETEPDVFHIHGNILLLQARFHTLAAGAQTLIVRLETNGTAQAPDGKAFIEAADRFVGELVLAADAIGKAVHHIETSGFERWIEADMKPHWASFRRWFVSEPGRPSNAELLRERARGLITAGLSAIARLNDRRVHRIDRASDFRVLARWFAQTESDADAHRLWRSTFGLSPARHLLVNDRTLDDHETRAIPANTSWLDAPPLRISTRFRRRGDSPQTGQTGMLSRMIDRTADKERLAAAAHEEAVRILQAQSRFGTGHRLRLSELENLEPGEFDMLLDLLGEAVSARVFSNEVVEILSADGSLSVRLEPTGDGREAMIVTDDGMFSGPDQWIRIDPILTDMNFEMQRCR